MAQIGKPLHEEPRTAPATWEFPEPQRESEPAPTVTQPAQPEKVPSPA